MIASSKPQNVEVKPVKKGLENSIFNLKLSPEQLAKQVDGYTTMKFHQTLRGAAVCLIGFSVVLTIVVTQFLTHQSWWEVVPELVIFLVLAAFIARGSRVAMILAILLWTADKVTQLANGTGGVSIIFWWFIMVSPLAGALQVEFARRKGAAKTTPLPTTSTEA